MKSNLLLCAVLVLSGFVALAQASEPKITKKVFFDIEIDGKSAGEGGGGEDGFIGSLHIALHGRSRNTRLELLSTCFSRNIRPPPPFRPHSPRQAVLLWASSGM